MTNILQFHPAPQRSGLPGGEGSIPSRPARCAKSGGVTALTVERGRSRAEEVTAFNGLQAATVSDRRVTSLATTAAAGSLPPPGLSAAIFSPWTVRQEVLW